MAKKVKSFRLDVDLIDWVDGYATERKSTQAAVVEEALRSFKADSEGGVPDLPSEAQWKNPPRPVTPKPAAPVVRASSLLARQRANPVGMSRQDLVNRLGQGPKT